MVTDSQVRLLMKLIQDEPSLKVAAAKAGMDEKTARKYRDLVMAVRGVAFRDAVGELREIVNITAAESLRTAAT